MVRKGTILIRRGMRNYSVAFNQSFPKPNQSHNLEKKSPTATLSMNSFDSTSFLSQPAYQWRPLPISLQRMRWDLSSILAIVALHADIFLVVTLLFLSIIVLTLQLHSCSRLTLRWPLILKIHHQMSNWGRAPFFVSQHTNYGIHPDIHKSPYYQYPVLEGKVSMDGEKTIRRTSITKKAGAHCHPTFIIINLI